MSVAVDTRPGWVIARLALWAVAIEGGVGFGLGGALRALAGGAGFAVDLAVQLMASVGYFLVCLREAGVLSPGDRRAALGFAPVRWGRVAGIGVPLVALNFVLAGLLITQVPWFAEGITKAPAQQMAQLGGAAGVLLLGVWSAAVAPVVEELVFRGWVWTGLRRAWGPWATGATTSVLFAAAHAQQGVAKAVLLLPFAALLALVRHVGGGIGGTIALHMLNNAPLLLGAILLAVKGDPR